MLPLTPVSSSVEFYVPTSVFAVAFDLRDPDRSGIARVARSLARAFVAQFSREFFVTLAGPEPVLRHLGVQRWGEVPSRIVSWNAGRYSVAAEMRWGTVSSATGDAIWYFPHWDVPWHALPARYVVTVHDLGHLQLSGVSWAKRALARRWISHALNNAAAATSVSEFSARQAARAFPRAAAKLRAVPNGVDDMFFRPPGKIPSDILERIAHAPYVLSVGIRKRHKNLSVAIHVLDAMPSLRWVVAGEYFPEWEDVLDLATRAGVRDRIIDVNRPSDEHLAVLYANAVCLLFPSRFEGFGLPILEALACGAPVVTSSAAGSVETLGGCGWVCDPDRPAEFVDAVGTIMNLGPARTEIAERGRAHARQFTWQRAAACLAEIFRSVA